jgi:peptidoglycan/LPS O-acetylase OafA/YrhL
VPSVAARPEKFFDSTQRIWIDLMRVLAVNLVVYIHLVDIFEIPTRFKPHGLGVVLSFLLSGFLIFSTAWSRVHKGGDGLVDYLVDRASRIFVPMLPALCLIALANVFFIDRDWGQRGLTLGPAAFTGNLFLLNDHPVFNVIGSVMGDISQFHIRQYNGAKQFWTVPIEFWTYVLFGVLFFGWYRRERMSALFCIVAVAVATPVFLWNAFGGGGRGLTLVWCVGALFAYLWMNGLGHFPRRVQAGCGLMGVGVACLAASIREFGFEGYGLLQTLFVALILFGSMLAVSSCKALLARLKGPASWASAYAYSLFLMHFAVIVILREHTTLQPTWPDMAMALLATHVAGYGLYLVSERHYKRVGAAIKKWVHGRRRPSFSNTIVPPVEAS